MYHGHATALAAAPGTPQWDRWHRGWGRDVPWDVQQCWKSPGRRHQAGKEAARGSRHAQQGCPSEGHCREHRLKEAHVAQQRQGPSKSHFNPSGQQAGCSQVDPAPSAKPPAGGDRRREVLAPSLVTREPRRAPTHGRFPGQAPDEGTRVSPATGAEHLQSHFPAHRGTARARGTEPGGACTGKPRTGPGPRSQAVSRGFLTIPPPANPNPSQSRAAPRITKSGAAVGKAFRLCISGWQRVEDA